MPEYEAGINAASCLCLACGAYACTWGLAGLLAALNRLLPTVAVQADWLAR